jgi:DNA-binding NarL/FixJ family response regulator
MGETGPIRVLVADDHDLFRDGIVGLLRAQPDIEVVGEAGDGLEAAVLAQGLLPDVVLLDINMPGADGIEAARMITGALPECRVVMLTVRDEDERIFEAIRAGASGYLLKTIRSQQLAEMVRAAARGEAALSPAIAARVLAAFRGAPPAPAPDGPRARPAPDEPGGPDELTLREQEILARLAAGLSDKEIAAELTISLYTVKAHVRSILSKLHVANRREAARQARSREAN